MASIVRKSQDCQLLKISQCVRRRMIQQDTWYPPLCSTWTCVPSTCVHTAHNICHTYSHNKPAVLDWKGLLFWNVSRVLWKQRFSLWEYMFLNKGLNKELALQNCSIIRSIPNNHVGSVHWLCLSLFPQEKQGPIRWKPILMRGREKHLEVELKGDENQLG